MSEAELKVALGDTISELARCADELAFWRYQAIWHRAFMLRGNPNPGQQLLLEESRVWREAEKQLEEQRVQENRERYAQAEARAIQVPPELKDRIL